MDPMRRRNVGLLSGGQSSTTHNLIGILGHTCIDSHSQEFGAKKMTISIACRRTIKIEAALDTPDTALSR